jgi:acetylornithine deacetylase
VAGLQALLGGAATVDLAFWTEAALLAEAGIDCVVWGPGAIGHAHAADEWVSLDELERATRTFEAIFEAARATQATDPIDGDTRGAG